MTKFKKAIENLGPDATPKQLERLIMGAERAGRAHDLGRAFLVSWNLQTGLPTSNDRVLRLLIRTGLRREALRMAGTASFDGKDGFILRLKQLLPLPIDRGDTPQ